MASLSPSGRLWRGPNTPACYLPTETDLDLYRDLACGLNAPPNAHICRYLGPAGEHLVFLGESGTSDWRRLQVMAHSRWPDLPEPGRIASDGTPLETLPERIVYEMLSPLLAPGMALDLHQPIEPGNGEHRADMTLRLGSARLFIEVVGCCGSDRIVRNDNERRWLARLDRRLDFYRALDLSPVCIHLDLLAQPGELRACCRTLVSRLVRDGGRR